MDEFSGFTAWREAFAQSTIEMGTQVATFIPNLVLGVFIALLGWILSRLAAAAVGKLFRTFGLDRAADRLLLTDALDRAGVRMALSQIAAKTTFWLLMLGFVLLGAQTLGISAVSETVERLVRFIPDVLGAVVILFLGLPASRFIGTVVRSGAAAAGISGAERFDTLVRVIVSALVLVIALEQLGIATSIFVGPVTVVLAALFLSAGLAFALGAYPIVTHILAGHFLKQSLPRDAFVEVDGRRGTVDRIGATDTLFSNGEESWSIPNARLLELTVNR